LANRFGLTTSRKGKEIAVNESLYDIPLKSLDGRPTRLRDFAGQVLLIVNVASKCGLTPQYAGLESLFKQYRQRGLQVLGFPCNDFAAQEPGAAEEIQAFCTTNYGIDFPMFEKLNINSAPRHPLYAQLLVAQPEAVAPAGSDFREKLAGYGCSPKQPSDVLWNFEKFLVDRSGQVVGRFTPDTAADDPALIAAIEAALA
jgi:glutathione peroxidase